MTLQLQIIPFHDGDSCSQVKTWQMPCRNRETAYKQSIKCTKEQAQRTGIHFPNLSSWSFVRIIKAKNSARNHLSGLHMTSVLASGRHWVKLYVTPWGRISAWRLKAAFRHSEIPLLPFLSKTGGTFASPSNLPLLQTSQFPDEKGTHLTGLTFSILRQFSDEKGRGRSA